jgi:hypothetical protein
VAKKNNIKVAAKNSVVFKFHQKARIDINNKVCIVNVLGVWLLCNCTVSAV